MEKLYRFVLVLAFALALLAGALHTAKLGEGDMSRLAAMSAAVDGYTVTAVYDGDRIRFALLDSGGVIRKSFSIPRMDEGSIVLIADLAVGEDGVVYYLKHYADPVTGALTERQELAAYRWRWQPWGRSNVIPLEAGEKKLRYGWLDVTTSLLVTAVTDDGAFLSRNVYDMERLFDKQPVIKNTRTYPAAPGEGVYSAVMAGSDVVYLSMTGKLFLTEADKPEPRQIYPLLTEGEPLLSYALFVEPESQTSVIFGEQRSGNLCRISTTDSSVEYIAESSRELRLGEYVFGDLTDVSYAPDGGSFTACVMNPATYETELVVSEDGFASLISVIKRGVLLHIWEFVKCFVIVYFLVLLVVGVLETLGKAAVGSRTILLKLIMTGVPLLAVSIILFGVFTYRSYYDSLRMTYTTQTEDQGNLLRALFGSESFDSITSPDRYGGAEYRYIKATMDTRDVYTSSAYFVNRKLYTGVNEMLPSLYPFSVTRSSSAYDLYHRAAISGKQQTGVIDDQYGERIACVTPAGSSTGDMVFLLETSVFTAELQNAAKPYLKNYLMLAGGLLLVSTTLLLIAILRIMSPLREVSGTLEQYSKGNRSARILSHTNDELADISRVFNKMAGDLEAQSYNLRNLTDTYYRFIPKRMFELLGKENLSELELGSVIRGSRSVLSASLTLDEDRLDADGQEELINCFFAILNRECDTRGVTVLADGIGLRHLLVLCEEPAVAAEIAFAALAQADSHNAKSPVQSRMDVSFFLHTGELAFGIFGDEGRYVPSLLSPDMERTLANGSRFRRLSGRVLVTDAAYRLLNAEKYRHRFIGYTEETEESPGLYDFYDSCPAAAIRLFSETEVPFARAVALYYQRRYYDAKSLFTVVLRDNQYDNVARHYIFQCEKRLGKQAEKYNLA